MPLCSGGGNRVVRSWEVGQHAASVTWTSPCHCFRVAAYASINDCGNVGYHASIDLSSLAGAARFR